VATYGPSKSQKRARRQSAHLVRLVGAPTVDQERLDLYARWHADRQRQRGWEPAPISAEDYAIELAFPHPAVREVTFRDPARDDLLVGVGIVDEVPDALSAVYFFWHPEHAPPSLGTAHIVRLIDDAAGRGLSYVYLGYRVDGCPSLAYKGRFQPQQSLAGWPADDEEPPWGAAPAFEPETPV
jgi:arginine-tRNA-protein transferase